jgi:hypothetical protein
MESINEVILSSLNDPRKTELLNTSNLIDDSISTIWEEGFGFYCESDDDNLALFGVGGPA